MSQNQPSACIPPPSDYAPRGRPPQSGRFPERGRGRGGGSRGGYKKHTGQTTTFQRDQLPTDEDRMKNQPKDRFHRNEDDDYFSHIQDENEDDHEIKEGTLGTSTKTNDNDSKTGVESDEDDPLDAYMRSLESDGGGLSLETQSESLESCRKAKSDEPDMPATVTADPIEKRGIRLDIDDSDDLEESYYQFVEKQAKTRKPVDETSAEESEARQSLIDYDKDGNVLGARKVKREIDPLAAIDHSKINYESFEKVFYQEHHEIEKLTQELGEELRAKLDINVSGDSVPKPVCSFAHFKFDEQLMKVIRRSEYTQPTPIQAQAIPAALLGRNIIGIAMTGSGKTAAYLWPMIVHIMGQPDLKRGDGPIGLVLVPTRELALQVYGEAKKFSSSYKIAVVCAYGGGSKYEQSKDLEAGAEIVVATPGRLIDLIKMGVTNLKRVTYLVLDEADRFFEMGFEIQVRSICDHIRPDRQTLLFSATFKERIEQLARTVTDNPVKIVQRSLGEANEDVTQHVVVVASNGPMKWEWLVSRLVEFTSAGSVLIFVTRIVNSEELHNNLKEQGRETLLLHGDMEQSERNRVITAFKRNDKDIMIATDVAARGLDIAHIKTVINYDVARDIDTHIHRVGRTGRAGSKGDAYTLITEKDKDFAGHLVKNLESSNQEVSEELMKLAMQSHNFRKSRTPKQNRHQHNRTNQHASSSSSTSHHHQDYRDKGSNSKRQHDDSNPRVNQQQQNYTHRHHHGGDRSRQSYVGQSRDQRDIEGQRTDHDRSSYNDHRKRSRWY